MALNPNKFIPERPLGSGIFFNFSSLSTLSISFMSCSICATRALRCFLTGSDFAKSATLRVHNVRYLTTENPGRMEEPPYRNRIGSITALEDPTRLHESSGGVAQETMMPVALRSKRDSLKSGGIFKPQASPKNDASFDQSWRKQETKSPRQRRDTTSGWPRDSIREKKVGSSKLATLGRKARLRDYSAGCKGTARSSRSPTVSAEIRTGVPNYKDQREPWQTQKSALSGKFGPMGWLPRKRLSPDTLDGIRTLHGQYPDKFTTSILADQFKISPEAIRRILKSKWRPKDEEEERRRRRWEKRGENIWTQMVEMGIKPPRKWRDMGVGELREREPTRGEHLESQIKSKSKKVTSSLLGQSTTDLRTLSANRHDSGGGSLVSLSDKIL